MARIAMNAVTVDFVIYNANMRSLKKRLLHKGTGGHFGFDAGTGVTVRALDKVDLTFEHGDRVGLIGRNGSGKTTLLRVLAGVYQPTQGSVRREGSLASVFDIFLGIDPESTGYENIMLRGLLLGLLPRQVRNLIDEIGTFTELGDYLAMPVRTYSTGMMLRLAFAVFTCVESEILLMDEWIGVGDASFVQKAEKRMNELVGRAGIMVLASHNNALLERTCTRGVLMHEGRVQAFGPIQDVLREYEQLS